MMQIETHSINYILISTRRFRKGGQFYDRATRYRLLFILYIRKNYLSAYTMSTITPDTTTAAVPTGSMEVLSQEIDEKEGMYRIRSGQQVYYLTISTDVFDEDTMCRPYLLLPQLPNLLAYAPSRKLRLARNADDGSLAVTADDTDPLREITFTWHADRIDVLSLPRIKRLNSGVFETVYRGGAAVAKIACFEWQIPSRTRETWAYCILTKSQQQQQPHRPSDDGGSPLIAPEFLGHLTENGRVIGFLMEKLEGRCAGPGDLAPCAALLKRLHGLGDLGLVHGDVNRYNFVVNEGYGGVAVRMVDFEHAQDYDEELAREELESLPAELAEETGRGSSITYYY
ncbi:alpha-galactosidase A [Xylaria bambusicola]|uniref:alpha-galactosidase A n=1 Tax=Xylaria bambusicola TaxID=326684 RepID=UPI002007D7B3|nr:alpha-galactosidase A [Xylaria bambusicola]KAI0515410.1 alpha-galactosidase A [Xylaria bambusicola]